MKTPTYIIVLLVLYGLMWLSSLVAIIKNLFGTSVDFALLLLYIFWFILSWIIIYLLRKQKKIAFRVVILSECVKLVSLITTFFTITIPFANSLLSTKASQIIMVVAYIKFFVPFVYVWLAFKVRKYLVN